MIRAATAAVMAIGCAAAPVPLAAVERPAVLVEGRAEQGGLIRGRAPVGTVSLVLEAPDAEPAAVAVAADGRFVAGLDRDAGPVATLVATLADGSVVTTPLAVAPRAWRLEQIDAPYRAGRTSAEFERLRPIELATIAAARATDPARADPGGWRQPFAWPATGRISGLFGAQRVYQGRPGSYHGGIDIALPTGAPVRAPADGVVTLAADEPLTLEGRLLLVDHGAGLESAFLHLSSIAVAAGERVVRGQVIGRVGATGRATGPHLHWGVRWQTRRLDPLLVAEPMAD